MQSIQESETRKMQKAETEISLAHVEADKNTKDVAERIKKGDLTGRRKTRHLSCTEQAQCSVRKQSAK